MKKNWTMRVAVLMVALTLITACFVSGTYAKYVTSGTANDTARVAKFGVSVEGSSDLFRKQYNTHDDTFAEAKSVISTDKVVAPGTDGSFTDFAIKGMPEVAVRVTYEVTEIDVDNWVYNDGTDDEFYCPIFIQIGDTWLSGLDYASADDFEAAISDNVAAYSKDYPARTKLGQQTDDALAISWKWNFTGATGLVNNQDDVKDTFLGDQAADDNAATIALTVACTVTQID